MIRLISRQDAQWFKLWLLGYNQELSFHSQLNNYFLADTDQFGALGQFNGSTLLAVELYSKFDGAAYIHMHLGRPIISAEALEFMGPKVEVFLADGQYLETGLDGWERTLDTVPGMIIDHPAYSGVFWRTVPWHYGKVYRRGF